MHSRFLYFAHERLSPAELSAARLDGHLADLGEGYMPADAVETGEMRAASLRPLCTDRFAACLWSAAWVHGALWDPPARHSLTRAGVRRPGSQFSRRASFHDVGAAAGDIATWADVPVTTPGKTLVDLLRLARHDDVSAAWTKRAARGLVSLYPDAVDLARSRLEQSGRLPGKRTALTRLAALAAADHARDQEEVTR
ncbi:hypothetical protein M4I32_00960 [Microbacterium sp. LRZ72]|uniref:hypothetical protein n=1 Tax=Microbacterium sp. LRZ72 TaxID=2942481 RepID=UPI0029BADFEF|nr:hypothetical protein [Microbacterium sp. LRZ72]MDX2375370.1 hypothetical protein [Microbacterium sp. LRZ72]